MGGRCLQGRAFRHDARRPGDRIGQIEVGTADANGSLPNAPSARDQRIEVPHRGAIDRLPVAHAPALHRARSAGRVSNGSALPSTPESARRIVQSSLASPGGNTAAVASAPDLRYSRRSRSSRYRPRRAGSRRRGERRGRRGCPGKSTKAPGAMSISSAPRQHVTPPVPPPSRRIEAASPGTNPMSSPPTRDAAVCRTPRPFHPSITAPTVSGTRDAPPDTTAPSSRPSTPGPR